MLRRKVLAEILQERLNYHNFRTSINWDDLMSKRMAAKAGISGWKYTCTCGYETLSIGDAVGHIKRNKGHQLTRSDL